MLEPSQDRFLRILAVKAVFSLVSFSIKIFLSISCKSLSKQIYTISGKSYPQYEVINKNSYKILHFILFSLVYL